MTFSFFLHRRGVVSTRTTYRFQATIRLLTLALFPFNLLLTSTVTVPSSCHPFRLCLLSLLLSIRITITQPFYQIYHFHFGPVHTFRGLVLHPPSFFRSVKQFRLHFCCNLTFFWPAENYASRDYSC